VKAVIHVDPYKPNAPITSVYDPANDPREITYLRVSVTDRCNLRCRYCMPEDQDFLAPDHLLSFDEIEAVVSVLVGHGIRKIRLTGGEPLLRKGLAEFVARLKSLDHGLEVVMTTNGMLLQRHAEALRNSGLDRLNISLDTLRPDRFVKLSRRDGLADTLAGIEAAQAVGFERTKVNVVVMGGVNDDEISDLLAWAHGLNLELRFIEFMPMQSNSYGAQAERVPVAEIRRRIEEVGELIPRERESKVQGPAENYVLQSTGQRVGIIAAISLPFCATCNRIRLTSEGVLRSCLFEGGEVDVRDLVRSGNIESGLIEALDYLRRCKPPEHAGLGHGQMNRIGG
jgi:cyclic pyranopterin phosphate synthase